MCEPTRQRGTRDSATAGTNRDLKPEHGRKLGDHFDAATGPRQLFVHFFRRRLVPLHVPHPRQHGGHGTGGKPPVARSAAHLRFAMPEVRGPTLSELDQEPRWPLPPDCWSSSPAKKLPFRSLTSAANVSCDVFAASDRNLKCLPGTEADQTIVACVMIPSKVNWLGPESVALVGPLLPDQRMSNDATDASGGVCLVPGGRKAGNEFANWR